MSTFTVTRRPLDPLPTGEEWRATYEMLCGYCEHQLHCEVIEALIEVKSGGAYPANGWVTDPGAGTTCLSYEPRHRPALPRQQLRAIARQSEQALPPVCGGCAARAETEASVSLHTRRDFRQAVQERSGFTCHEDPEHKRVCGGWCRAIKARAQ